MRQEITLDFNCPDCKGKGWTDEKESILCRCINNQITENLKNWPDKLFIYKSKYDNQTYIETH